MIYFIPDTKPPLTSETLQPVLDRFGLADVFDATNAFATHEAFEGPDHKAGFYLSRFEMPESYDNIEWCETDCEIYIAHHPNIPSNPQTLSLCKSLTSYTLTLGDGNLWSLPLCRLADGRSPLPSTFTLRGKTVKRE